MKKHKKQQDKVQDRSKIKISIPNPWMLVSFILAIALAAVIIFKPVFLINKTGNVANPDDTAKKVIDFLNNNLVQPGSTASLVSVETERGLYKITTLYQGQKIPVYVTMDGTYLFVSTPIDITEEIPGSSQSTTFDAPDKAKPDVELYVMSFCPFGVQAENTMKPVFDLLGSYANFKIRFIVNVGGDTADSIQSLHGSYEAMEDLRQICIMKYYDAKTYWNYLAEFNEKCYSVGRDQDKLDECWKATAKKFSIDTNKIETCSKSKEAIDLIKVDEQLTEKNGVTGSPTLIINGKVYNGARTQEAFKQAICSGFTNPPAACQTNMTQTAAAASGSC